MDIWDLEDYLNEFDYEEKEKTISIKKNTYTNRVFKKKALNFNNLQWEDDEESE